MQTSTFSLQKLPKSLTQWLINPQSLKKKNRPACFPQKKDNQNYLNSSPKPCESEKPRGLEKPRESGKPCASEKHHGSQKDRESQKDCAN